MIYKSQNVYCAKHKNISKSVLLLVLKNNISANTAVTTQSEGFPHIDGSMDENSKTFHGKRVAEQHILPWQSDGWTTKPLATIWPQSNTASWDNLAAEQHGLLWQSGRRTTLPIVTIWQQSNLTSSDNLTVEQHRLKWHLVAEQHSLTWQSSRRAT